MCLELSNLDLLGMFPSGSHEQTWAGWGYLPAWLISPKYAAAVITALVDQDKLDGRILAIDAKEKPKKETSAVLFLSPGKTPNATFKTGRESLFKFMFQEGMLAEYEVLNSVFGLRRPSDNREILEIIAESAHVTDNDGSPWTIMIDKNSLATPQGEYKARELNYSHVDVMESSLKVRRVLSPVPAASAIT